MKKQTKKIEEKVFTAGEVGSILESMDDTMKMMSENYSSLAKTQGEMKETLVSMDGRLGNVEVRLGNVEERLDKVETKIDRLQDDMVEVKFELKRKVDAEEFEKLEKRVVKLEQLSFAR
ncbi:MAG: hypothetical protein WCJ51_04265 [Candidatus Moraniibacteriota bacterium]